MNRVLFKAAAIVNIAAAALIYVACSGDDGKDGPPGTPGVGCVGTPSATVAGGIDITCGGVPAGTLQPGAPGAPGTQGPPGGVGSVDGCYLQPSAAGGYDAICGGQNMGPLVTGGVGGGGCVITDGGAYWTFNCGGTPTQIGKAWCGDVAFNPSSQVCVDGAISGAKCGTDSINFDIHFCASGKKVPKCGVLPLTLSPSNPPDTLTASGGVEYDVATQFCGRKATQTSDSVFTRCGTEDVLTTTPLDANSQLQAPYNHPKGIGWFDPTLNFCLVGSAGPEVTSLCRSGVLFGGLEYLASQVCQNGAVKAICGNDVTNPANIYDVSTDFCQGVGANAVVKPYCGAAADKITYTAEQFCGSTYGKDSVFTLCGKLARTGSSTTTCATATGTWDDDGDGGTTPEINCTCNEYASSPTGCSFTTSTVTIPAYPAGEFDPTAEFCATVTTGDASTVGDGGSVSIATPTLVAPATSAPTPVPLCNSKTYVWEREFCGYNAGGTLEIYNRCGPNVTPGLGKYTVTTHYCPTGAAAIKNLSICNTDSTYAAGTNTGTTLNRYNPEKEICDARDPAPTAISNVVGVNDGQRYKYAKIGTLTWLAENLNYAKGSVGTVYTLTTPPTGYGRLYSYTEASLTGSNAICPTGWRVPNDTDWLALSTAAGNLVTMLKSADVANTANSWIVKGTDDFGFNALPAGRGAYTPDYETPTVTPPATTYFDALTQILYSQLNSNTYWWSSTAGSTANLAKYKSIAFNDVFLLSGESNASTSYYSVRCVK